LAKLFLKKNEERRIKSGHLWVFSNEVGNIEGEASSGDIVEVFDHKGNPLGSGFYNKNSLIAARLLSSEYDGDFTAYVSSALRKASSFRKQFYPNRESFRFVFSESDYLPGLIIDKYNNTFVLQIYSYGMEKDVQPVIDALKGEYNAENIFTRNDSYFRKLEGLPEADEVYYGSVKDEVIDDGEIKYKINFTNSQKTGFYFDQSDNRKFIEKIANGKTILDAFCNSGGFGLHAAFAGAVSVTFVDSSGTEIENAKQNFELNGLKTEAEFTEEDVFDYLEKCVNDKESFGVVMLDPPAFAKNKKSVPSALKGYTKLNKLALQIVNKEGYLVTSSCSHHITQSDLIEAINAASAKSGRKVQLIHIAGASLDHPQLPAMPETSYLKFAVFKVG
jgi:23S rRNA (cytosine1962-C5)-methyltransferase